MSRTPVTFGKKEYFKTFKLRHPAVEITPTEHLEILKTAGLVIADLLLKDGDLKMGSRIGNLNIRKFIPRGRGVSFVPATNKHESFKAGKAIYQFNDHSGGFIYRFFWNRKTSKGMTDKNMWTFRPIRSIKRKLAYILKNQLADFPIVNTVIKNA